MPSRKIRKRYRRKLEATGVGPKLSGGWGKDSVTRSDLRLARHAIRMGWPIPDNSREALVESVMAIVEDDDAGGRKQVAACWVVLEMMRDNMRQS